MGIFGNDSTDTTTTSTQTITPWGPQGDALQKIYGQAGQIYNKQMGQGPIGFDPSSSNALDRMARIARGGNPLLQSSINTVHDIGNGTDEIGFGRYADLYNSQAIQNGQQYRNEYNNNAISNAGQYKQLYNDPGVDTSRYRQLYGNRAITNDEQYRNIYDDTQGRGSLDRGMFGELARGDMLDSNPYRERAIQQSLGDAMTRIKAQFSGAGPYTGRFGSSAYGDFAARQLGSIATNARMQGYDTDTQNMMAAAGARSNQELSRQGLGLQAATGLSSLQEQNRQAKLAEAAGIAGAQGQNAQTRLSAASGLSGMQLQNDQQRQAAMTGLSNVQNMNRQSKLAEAAGIAGIKGQNIQNRLSATQMAQAVSDMRYSDPQHLAQVGAARELMKQQSRDYSWDELGNYARMVGGIPGSAGTTTNAQPTPSLWQTALGIGLGGAGLIGGALNLIPGL